MLGYIILFFMFYGFWATLFLGSLTFSYLIKKIILKHKFLQGDK